MTREPFAAREAGLGRCLAMTETEGSELHLTHACMSRPVTPMKPPEEPQFWKDPLGK